MARYSKQETEEARDMLHAFLEPGDTVYTVLRHVSASGMTRWIDLYKVTDDGPYYLSGYAAVLLEEPRPNGSHQGIKVGGCGMDMGFHLVYALSYRLWPEGFDCIGSPNDRRCPSNDHSNPPHPGQYGYPVHHTDGGYALNQRWL
jgi:hypothetical protein